VVVVALDGKNAEFASSLMIAAAVLSNAADTTEPGIERWIEHGDQFKRHRHQVCADPEITT
jgi:hypothetical protein